MCTSDKGKQTNKQTSGGSTCGGADAGGNAELHNMQSPIHNASEYAEELQRCIRDASEKHGVRYAGLYSDRLQALGCWGYNFLGVCNQEHTQVSHRKSFVQVIWEHSDDAHLYQQVFHTVIGSFRRKYMKRN